MSDEMASESEDILTSEERAHLALNARDFNAPYDEVLEFARAAKRRTGSIRVNRSSFESLDGP